ncbi:LptF/LptG family permease [Phycisphaerales bacterium AB-hyl4]|uniref:LptF/LptG family permease n=1 Tax=Natronomicrosphaera hydrolytica TaxID=3242702 RepID=A0ABV4U401_9BACT
MKTLDRYILREFFVNFVVLLLVLMTLFVVIDMIVGLEDFVQAGEAHAEQYGGQVLATLVVMIDYYAPVLVMVYVFLSGLIVVGAMGFTIATFQRTREMTAMVAGGISLYRVSAPILLAGMALNALSLPIQEFVIPGMASKLVRSKSQLKHELVDTFPIRFARDDAGRLFTAADFDASEQRLSNLTVIERNEAGLAQRRITTEAAYWDQEHEHWRLVPAGMAVSPHFGAPGEGDAFDGAPESVPYLATELSPTVLMARRATSYPQLLSLVELQQMQANPAVEPHQRAHIARIVWGRFSLLVVNVLVLVMGLAIFLRLGHVNMVNQAVIAAGICLGAWGTGLLLIQAGGGALNPVASAWLPVVLFLPLTAGLLQFVRT